MDTGQIACLALGVFRDTSEDTTLRLLPVRAPAPVMPLSPQKVCGFVHRGVLYSSGSLKAFSNTKSSIESYTRVVKISLQTTSGEIDVLTDTLMVLHEPGWHLSCRDLAFLSTGTPINTIAHPPANKLLFPDCGGRVGNGENKHPKSLGIIRSEEPHPLANTTHTRELRLPEDDAHIDIAGGRQPVVRQEAAKTRPESAKKLGRAPERDPQL
ncbi:hypothetical protein B0H14DRAFT_2576337 [Mycena olivaceomarginata]|nr:hypothetical protein B0H14DRAFT_2576337 [Mycena olivaceomarginata]